MPSWVSIVVGILVITFLVAVFIIGYKLNKKTPVPAGCENLLEACSGCRITSCTHHQPTSDKVEVI